MGAGDVTASGPGTVILTAANTYTGGTTISGGILQLGNGGTVGSVVGAIVNNGTLALDRSDAGLILSGVISGTGTLVQMGTGTSILTAANTYSGGTTISAGTLQLGNAGITGSIVGNVVDNGILQFNRTDGALNLAGNITGTGSVIQAGTGTVTLSGTNTYSGVTTVSAGTLLAGSATALSVNSAFTVSGATLDLGGFSNTIGSLAGTGTVTDSVAGTAVLSAGSNNVTTTFSGTLQNGAGTLALTKSGTGTLTLSGTNTYSGATTVSAGTLQAGSGSALSASSDFTVTSILDLGGFSNAIGSLAGTGTVTNTGAGATLNVGDDNSSSVFSGTLQNGPGALALTKSGTGTLTLSGTNTYSGGTTISAGILQLGNATATGSITGNILDSGVLQFNRTDAGLNLSGNITGAGSVVQAGTGTSFLSGTNTYGGVTTVSVGTLRAGSTTGLSSNSDFTVTSILNLGGFSNSIGSLAGTGTVTDTGAAATLTAEGDGLSTTFSGVLQNGTGILALTKSGTGALILTGTNLYTGLTTISAGILQLGNATATGSIVGNITDNGILQLDRSDAGLNLAGNISGAGSVVQIGTGSTVTLSGTNSYSGVTTVSAGTLQAGSITGLSAASNFTVSGAVLNLNGFSNAIGSLAGTGTVTNNGAAAAILSAGGDNASSVFSGTLQNGAGTLGLTKTGSGTFTVSGTNTYSGATAVSAGTLQAGSTTALSANSDFTVSSTLDLNGFSNTIGSLAGTGTVTNTGAGATLSVGGDNASSVFSGTLQNGPGALALNKTGTGTLILSGTSTYSGLTDVQGGVLSVRGALSNSAVHVETGATLGGNGIISGAVTILSGGILSPGNSGPGTLSVGSLVLNAGSVSDFDLGPAGVVGGASNDLVIVAGNLTLAGTLNIADSGGFGTGVYRLFNYGGTLSGTTMTIGTVPAGVSPGGLTIQTSVTDQVNLVVSGTSLLQFWDGPNSIETGAVTGGTGTWDNTTTNWTIANGTSNSAWRQGFAVFEGIAGTVTLAQNVTIAGLQFVTGGYLITTSNGSTITAAAGTILEANSGVIGTIGVGIVGAGDVTASGPGTVILTAANTYTGGTTISGGILQLGNGGNSRQRCGPDREQRDFGLGPVRCRADIERRNQRYRIFGADRDRHLDPDGNQHLQRRNDDRRRHPATGQRRCDRHHRG